MTVDISIMIAAASLAFAVITGIANLKRNGKNDTKADAAELVTVIVKLENIEKLLSEMRLEEKENREITATHGERLAKAEAQIKSLNSAVFGKSKDKEFYSNE